MNHLIVYSHPNPASFNHAIKETVVKVLNTQTQEVVRQIPSEEMLRMSQRITELLGVLFDDHA